MNRAEQAAVVDAMTQFVKATQGAFRDLARKVDRNAEQLREIRRLLDERLERTKVEAS